MRTLIGFGQVRHKRYRPKENLFTYPTYFLMLQMRSASAHQSADKSINPFIKFNKSGVFSFFDSDHGDGRKLEQGGALGWIEDLLTQEGVTDADGEIWLHTFPRVFGYTFKPVSFWYCHSMSGELKAILVEVNNTFGERHFYLIKNPIYGKDLMAAKEFHVSPFCEVKGHYRFRFLRTKETESQTSKTVVRIDYEDSQGALIHTSVSGNLEPLNATNKTKALLNYPLLTLMIIFRIHWQALKLWLMKIPFHSKPELPDNLITLVSPIDLKTDTKSL